MVCLAIWHCTERAEEEGGRKSWGSVPGARPCVSADTQRWQRKEAGRAGGQCQGLGHLALHIYRAEAARRKDKDNALPPLLSAQSC